MKSIYQLIPDIQELVGGKHGWLTEANASSLSSEIYSRLLLQYGELPVHPVRVDAEEDVQHSHHQEKGTLRLSQMGPRCPCALWHSIYHPESAEQLPPWAQVKFSFGHIIEGLAVGLAKAAGHTVVGEQDAVSVDGVVGHRDCIIDGCLVDVKSASSYSFKKFKDGSIAQNDTFGYLDQLDGYLLGSAEDPLLTVKDRGYLLAIDKQLGHMCLYEHHTSPDRARTLRERISSYKRIVELPSAPECLCGTVGDGKSGNIKLDVKAAYSAYKYCCFPSLRTFIYSNGPVYLTHVARRPDVPEVDKHGHIVH